MARQEAEIGNSRGIRGRLAYAVYQQTRIPFQTRKKVKIKTCGCPLLHTCTQGHIHACHFTHKQAHHTQRHNSILYTKGTLLRRRGLFLLLKVRCVKDKMLMSCQTNLKLPLPQHPMWYHATFVAVVAVSVPTGSYLKTVWFWLK